MPTASTERFWRVFTGLRSDRLAVLSARERYGGEADLEGRAVRDARLEEEESEENCGLLQQGRDGEAPGGEVETRRQRAPIPGAQDSREKEKVAQGLERVLC